MPRVDFYVLPYSINNCKIFACRLIEKVFGLRQTILILVDSPKETKEMDDLLWNFRDDSFIPHEIADQKATAPVQITDGQSLPKEPFHLLINLTTSIPNETEKFERIAELVSNEPEQQENNRQKYREYQKKGYSLFTHKIQ